MSTLTPEKEAEQRDLIPCGKEGGCILEYDDGRCSDVHDMCLFAKIVSIAEAKLSTERQARVAAEKEVERLSEQSAARWREQDRLFSELKAARVDYENMAVNRDALKARATAAEAITGDAVKASPIQDVAGLVEALRPFARVGERIGKLRDGEWIDLHPRNMPTYVLEEALDPADFRKATAALSALRPSPISHETADMRKVVEALGFEPDNHHNALGCPYCNPDGLTFAADNNHKALVEALEPLATIARAYASVAERNGQGHGDGHRVSIGLGDCRRAARALAAFQSRQEGKQP